MEPIDHIDLVVSDLERSLRFYTALLGPLGYVETGPITGERGERVVYLEIPSRYSTIGLRAAQSGTHPPDRYAIGLHHLAFAVPSREVVDERAAWLREQGHPIENGPQEWPYSPGYYAVFFPDPDGIKLEIVHRNVSGSGDVEGT